MRNSPGGVGTEKKKKGKGRAGQVSRRGAADLAGTMEIGGIEIAVVRKKIKNMYLRVLPPDGRVQITAPSGLRDGDVRHFAESKIDWILRKQKDVTVRAETGQRDYVTGETFYLWGDSFCWKYGTAKRRVAFSMAVRISGIRSPETGLKGADACCCRSVPAHLPSAGKRFFRIGTGRS